MIGFHFTGFDGFELHRDKTRDVLFLATAGRNAAMRMVDAQTWPKSGRFYYRRGRIHQASAPGEYPARDGGYLMTTVDFRVHAPRWMEIGTAAPYSGYLRDGTHNADGSTRMAARKMSQFALAETLPESLPTLAGFVRWRRGK